VVSKHPTVLAQAYYLHSHVTYPSGYPILNVTIFKDSQQITEADLKTKILSGLLNYCFELFGAAHPAKLETYYTYMEDWLQAYQDKAYLVRLSNAISKVVYFATIIAPIIDNIEELYGGTISEQVEATVSLFFDIMKGYEALKENYGVEKVDSIVNILIQHNLCSSTDYNPLELYGKFEEDPSRALEALKAIDSKVLDLELNSNAETILSTFLKELGESAIGEFVSGSALSLYAYFGSGLTATTAAQIWLSSAFTGLLKSAIPLALATAIVKSYILPMAEALNSAWDSMGHISDTFASMYIYGFRIANPESNVFNLTDSKVFAALLGIEYLSEYNYYMKIYFFRSRQLLKSQSELDSYKNSAQAVFSYAQKWTNTLKRINDMATAIVQSFDPKGETFNFEVLPPPETHPVPTAPDNSKGIILITNITSNITIQSGKYIFIVQNGSWLSNFTYSLCIDDAYGTLYLVIFNPPDQTYTIKVGNETLITLKNFEPSNDSITITEAAEIIGATIQFNVTASQIDPDTVVPEFPQILPVISIIITALIIMKKKIFKYEK